MQNLSLSRGSNFHTSLLKYTKRALCNKTRFASDLVEMAGVVPEVLSTLVRYAPKGTKTSGRRLELISLGTRN